jgi:two-component system response regulator MprA
MILIVEDDVDVRDNLADVLQLAGYKIVTASNGLDAYERLRNAATETLPDLILLDLTMPVMDGRHLRGELLKDEILARIPVVLISSAVDIKNEAASLGAAGYVKKPFKLDVLLDLIERSSLAP